MVEKPNYEEYYNRLTSYSNWKSDSNVYIKALVEAGFVYSGESDIVFCFKCGCTLDNWEEEDDPVARHELANKDCYFLLDRSLHISGNGVPISHQKSLSDYEKEAMLFDWVPGKGVIRIDEGNNVVEYSTAEPSHRSEMVNNESSQELHNPKMRDERLRFQSFASCPVHKHWPSPDVISSAGFYYDPVKEVMKCFCCGTTVEAWESEEQDVKQKHKVISPNCGFINGTVHLCNVGNDNQYDEEIKLFDSLTIKDKNDTEQRLEQRHYISSSSLQNNVHDLLPTRTQTSPQQQQSPRHSTPRQVTRPQLFMQPQRMSPQHPLQSLPRHSFTQYNQRPIAPPVVPQQTYQGQPRPQFHVDTRRNDPFLNRAGLLPYNASPQALRDLSNMSDVTKRLETFFTWPKTAYLQPFELAEAGFVYAGTGDAVKCYKCGVSLKNWEPKDNAWSEHEKFSPVCPLIVERVRQVHAVNQARQNNANSYGQQNYMTQSLQQQRQQQPQPNYGSPMHKPHSMMQESTHSSLNENFLRRYNQQYHHQPLYESSKSLPTGIKEKHRYNLQNYADNYRSSVTEVPPGLHNFSVPHDQTLQNSNNYSSVQNGFVNGSVYPIQNASTISNGFQRSSSLPLKFQPGGNYSVPLQNEHNQQPVLNTMHDLSMRYHVNNGMYKYTDPRESSNVYTGSRESSNEYIKPRDYPHGYTSSRESSNEYMVSRESYGDFTVSRESPHKCMEPSESSQDHYYSSKLQEAQNHYSSPPLSPSKQININSEENISKLEDMGFSREIIQQTIDCYSQYSSRSFSSLDDLAQAVLCYQENGTLEGTPFGKNLNVAPTKAGEDMIYNRVSRDKPISLDKDLKENDKQGCKICMDNDVEVTFVPCGHLIVCESCALGLKFCPLCRNEIKETVRTYYFGN